MITNISYNVLIERFRAFADGHFLIKGFTHGDPSNVNIEKGVEFPWMHVFPVEVAPQSGSRLYSFIITFADLPRDKETPPEYQREMLSDCIRLAEDLLAEIQNGLVLFGPNVEVDGSASIECFINEFSHTLTGVNLSLTLSVPWNWSACDIPADWSVGGSSSGGTGGGNLGVILETNGVLNGDQTLLNLQQGTNVTIVDNGNGTITINSIGDGTGTVTSVALTMPSGFIVSGSPITTAGTLAITGAGTSSDYIDGTGAVQPFPSITPQVNSDWNSSSGVSEILNKPTLATVATSGDYNDLSNLPTIPPAQVNADWNAVSGVAEILNKPTIPSGTVTSAALSVPSPANAALSVSGSPITSSGTFVISANGTIAQYIDGTGALKTFPTTLSAFIKGTVAGQLIQWNGSAWVPINGLALNDLTDATINTPSNGQVLTYDQATLQWVNQTPASGGTVTSVGLSLPAPINPAFSVSGSPVTTSGTLAISANGSSSQYVDGTGALQTMPTGLPPTGTAGGDLAGTYPNPTVDGIHGIDMQSGTPTLNDAWIYGGSPAKWQHQHINAGIVDNDSAVTGTTVKDSLNHLNTTKVESNAAITAGTATKITYDAKGLVTAGTTLAATDIPSGIDATKIGTGVVSNTEFGYLDGVTSAIQTQLNAKVDTSRTISTSSPLSGGGDLSANRTLSIADAVADGATKGAAAFTASDFNSASGVISIDYANGQKASAAQPGFLSAADWSTFNTKIGSDYFTMRMAIANVAPADGQIYYIADPTLTLNTNAALYRNVFPYACKLVGASITVLNVTATASNEASTLAFRLNNTTDTVLSNAVVFNGAPLVVNTYSVTGLSVNIAAGDTANIKWTCPTWATNPSAASISVILYFERV